MKISPPINSGSRFFFRNSFCGVLAEAYIEGAKAAGADIKQLYLGELKFDPILWHGYKEIQELEEDLKMAQEFILWAEHLVFVYPTWWGTIPALLKGFIDRTFLPGFAFLPGATLRNASALRSPLGMDRVMVQAHHAADLVKYF